MDQKYLNMIKNGLVYAIIPARSGSKGIPNKNIKSLQGFPMLAYSIAACKLCDGIDRILVSTDSSHYAEIAEYYGADVPFLRPAEISGDMSPDIEFMEHALKWMGDNEGVIPEYILHIRPTYPLREPKIIERALEIFEADKTATSLRSAHKSSVLPYKWFNLKEDGYFKPAWDKMTLDEANNPRQAFPDVYIPDGYVDVLSSAFIIKNGLMHGDKMIGFVVEDGIDVDTLKEMSAIEALLKNGSSPIYEYLSSNYETLEKIKK